MMRPLARSALRATVGQQQRAVAAPMVAQRWFSAGGFLEKDEVTSRVLDTVKAFEKVDAAKVNENSHFVNDLGLDSLDVVEVQLAFEDEFALEIPDAEQEKIQTVADAIAFISSHPQAK